DVIPEQKWIGCVGVSKCGPGVAEAKAGIAAVELISAVGARNIQDSKAVVLIDIHVFRAEAQPCITSVAIQQQRGSNAVSTAYTDHLDAPGRSSGLAAIESVAFSGPKPGRIEDVAGRNAVTRKDRTLLVRVVI